jgi:hypothetical protein
MTITLRQTASLLIAAVALAPAVVADAGGTPPAFTPEELALIARDARLRYAARACPQQLRRALDTWSDPRGGVSPAPVLPEPCRPSGDDAADMGRASDEAALDLLKLLKEAAGQGTSR